MKNKTLLFTLIFFFILGVFTQWKPIVKLIVIVNALSVLFLTSIDLWRLIKNGQK